MNVLNVKNRVGMFFGFSLMLILIAPSAGYAQGGVDTQVSCDPQELSDLLPDWRDCQQFNDIIAGHEDYASIEREYSCSSPTAINLYEQCELNAFVNGEKVHQGFLEGGYSCEPSENDPSQGEWVLVSGYGEMYIIEQWNGQDGPIRGQISEVRVESKSVIVDQSNKTRFSHRVPEGASLIYDVTFHDLASATIEINGSCYADRQGEEENLYQHIWIGDRVLSLSKESTISARPETIDSYTHDKYYRQDGKGMQDRYESKTTFTGTSTDYSSIKEESYKDATAVQRRTVSRLYKQSAVYKSEEDISSEGVPSGELSYYLDIADGYYQLERSAALKWSTAQPHYFQSSLVDYSKIGKVGMTSDDPSTGTVEWENYTRFMLFNNDHSNADPLVLQNPHYLQVTASGSRVTITWPLSFSECSYLTNHGEELRNRERALFDGLPFYQGYLPHLYVPTSCN